MNNMIFAMSDQTREYEEEMSGFYSKWLDENISKLVYSEKEKKFIINQ